MSSKKYDDDLMPGSDEDEHDAYLEQMKAEGAERDDDESESSEGKCIKSCVLVTAFYRRAPTSVANFSTLC